MAGDTSDAGAAAGGPAERCRALLKGLCKTKEDNEILDQLCAAVVDVSDETITFEDDMECNYAPGGEVVYHDNVPRSFSEIAASVGALDWDGGGPEVGYALRDDGDSVADPWLFVELEHDSPDECARVKQAGPVIASFVAGQNGLFFDPTTKLKNGEPGLAFVSHEGGGWVSVKSTRNLDYGQILLRMLADAMVGTDHIPEIYF